jgi:thioredoxin-dependent peroxiredoxin
MNYNYYNSSLFLEENMQLRVGQKAPEFRLPSHLGQDVCLSDLHGKTVVLAFFPMAWTPI